MWKVINVSADRAKLALQRKATKFDPEPAIAGARLRQGHLMLLEDEQFERLKPTLEAWKANGMVEFGPAKGDEAPRPGVSVVARPEHALDPMAPMLQKEANDPTPEHHHEIPPPSPSVPLPPEVPQAAVTPTETEAPSADVPGPEEWTESPTDADKPKRGKKKLFDNK